MKRRLSDPPTAGRFFARLSPVIFVAACSGQIDGHASPLEPASTDLPQPAPADLPLGGGNNLPGALPPADQKPERLPASPGIPTASGCADSAVDSSPLRRLTHREYHNTVSELLGDITDLDLGFAREATASEYPFLNRAREQVVPPVLASQFFEAAEQIAARAVAGGIERLVPCAASAPDAACAQTFVADFGKKAFRGPVDAEMTQTLMAIYEVAQAGAGFEAGIEAVLTAMLQMPDFLYRIEGNASSPDPNGRLDSWDVAERLSYLLWNTLPDDELFAAAELGALQTPEQVSAQVARMLQDPRAKEMVTNFHEEWLRSRNIPNLERDADAFPNFTPQVAEAMRQELRSFVEHAVWNDGGSVASLLTTPATYLNDVLGEFYGVDGLGAEFERVEQAQLGGRPAAGLLTLGGLMAMHSDHRESSPIHRGLFVRSSFLCESLPPPPADADVTLPEHDPSKALREVLALHSSEPACSGCHSLMDPIGLGFEHFDASGGFRLMEAGSPVDASGNIVGSDVSGPFNGVVELAEKLSQSPQVERCLATQWFRYSFGREPAANEACVVEQMSDALRSGGTLDLITRITSTTPFLYRSVSEGAL